MINIFNTKSLSSYLKLGAILAGFFTPYFLSLAKVNIHDFETTRMKSTAGAGAGSILLDEATLLNPAPLGFYSISSIYLQKSGTDISSDSANPRGQADSGILGVAISDSKGSVGGSFSYTKQEEGFNTRKRFGISLAKPLGKQSSVGVTYRNTKDSLSNDGVNITDDKYGQFIFGVSHLIDNDFRLGLVLVDPFKERAVDTKGIVGLEYILKGFITLMMDVGADYNQKLSDAFLYRAALQFTILENIYLRFGGFNDKGIKEKGTGIGLGWIQPRLTVELALKNSDVEADLLTNQTSENIKETSFSLAYRF